MRAVVRQEWARFTAPLEGVVSHMYLDVLGLVTVAAGNLIDPIPLALECPFTHKATGAPATPQEIADEWHRVKARQDLANHRFTAFEPLCELELNAYAIAKVEMKRLDANDAQIRKVFPDFEDLPADAQMGIHSMAWAMGCGAFWHFPKFRAAILRGDYAAAAAECRMNDEHNPGLVPRNVANKKLFENASSVVARGLDPNRLYFFEPEALESVPEVPDTQPSVSVALAAADADTKPDPAGVVESPESDGGPISFNQG